MDLKIKNWKRFQHFKDRRPPWIKLYREILDDPDWHDLDPMAAKALVMLWLIASETDGYLPDIRKISFRLRVTEEECKSLLLKLGHWIDITAISGRYQGDTPETETEKKNNRSFDHDQPTKGEGFDLFWETYPKKVKKKEAKSVWVSKGLAKKKDEIIANVQSRTANDRQWKEGFIPDPTTFLRGERWEDEVQTGTKNVVSIYDN